MKMLNGMVVVVFVDLGVDGREAIWSCSLSIPLPSLAWVSARNMSSKSWSASTSTSTPWLGLGSIPLRRLASSQDLL